MEEKFNKEDKDELVLNVALYIGVIVLFLLTIFVILITPVHARTQSTDLNNSIFADCGGTRSYNKYCDYNSNRSPQYVARNLNTTISGITYQISFGFQRQMSAYSQYIVNVYAMSTDFRNNDLSVVVYGSNIENSINNVMNNISYTFVSKNLIQIIIPENSYTYHYIVISGDSLTGVNSYGVKNITLSWDDGSTDMSGVIDNQTQNTQNIINNANENTQEVTNKITETYNQMVANGLQENNNERRTLSNMCKNIYYTEIGMGKTINSSGGLVDTLGAFYMTDYVAINLINDSSLGGSANRLYITEPSSSSVGYYFILYDNDKNVISYTRTSTRSITIPDNAVWFRFASTSANTTISRYSNNCIEASDKIYSAITNDSLDSGIGSDFFNGFSDDDPGGISSIVTRPLVIINSLLENNGQCDNLNLPSFMNVDNAYLPSGCIFWNRVPNTGITLWNIFVCGVCSYVILIDLFKLIQDLKTPTHNKVEVLDL